MTRFIFTISVFFSLVFLGDIQRAAAQRVGLGVTGGGNLSTHTRTFRLDDPVLQMDLEPEFRSGYHYGIVLRRVFSDHVRLQLEPRFASVGAEYDGIITFAENDLMVDGTSEIWYIQLPVLFQLTTTPPDRAEFPRPWPEFTFHFSAGAYAGYLLESAFSGTIRGSPLGVEFSDNFVNDSSNQFAQYDAGFVIGGGTEFGLNTKIGADLRLMYGLKNAADTSDVPLDLQNVVINLSFYFIF